MLIKCLRESCSNNFYQEPYCEKLFCSEKCQRKYSEMKRRKRIRQEKREYGSTSAEIKKIASKATDEVASENWINSYFDKLKRLGVK